MMSGNIGEKVGILLPTYNESKNIGRLILKIREIVPASTIVVVDDSSPDGTGDIVSELMKVDKNLFLLSRHSRGRGSAGIAGFKRLLEDVKLEKFIEMDCDFSHNPKYIPALLNQLGRYDMVVGSRYIRGGMDIERGVIRRFISKFANFYSRLVLEVPVLHATSGFRAFNRKALEKIH